MQVNIGSEVTPISKNIWKKMDYPTTIKLFGKFEVTIKSSTKINVCEIIVADCVENHWLIGINVLRFDAADLN